jgi:putative ABC transport system substrate-binding protein
MRRRDFLTSVAAAALPHKVRAQTSRSLRHVGILMAGVEGSPENTPRIAAFRDAFAGLGWKEGDNVHVELRWSGGQRDLINGYARELVALAPDVIVANSSTVVAALRPLTATIPVVFALAVDPVGRGDVQSLARPGANFTGFTFIDPALIGKWVELLKAAAPLVSRAAVLFNPATSPFYYQFVQALSGTRTPDGVDVVPMPVADDAELVAAMDALSSHGASALLIGPDPFNQSRIAQIAGLTLRNRLPAISVYRPFATQGGLLAYGPDTADVFRQAAGYVDRILRGAKPADLPVQRPTKFEFIVNAKTAKAFGVEVPANLLFRADEVIE